MDTSDGKGRASAHAALARVALCEVDHADLPDHVAHKGHPAATSEDPAPGARFAIDGQGLTAARFGDGAPGAIGLAERTLAIASAGLAQLCSGKAAPSACNGHAE